MESGSDELTGKRVLICDDTDSIRSLMRINLEIEGFVVEEADDGHVAMARLIDLDHEVPDVVILDATMKDRDGWWTVQAIRSHPRTRNVPVILVTGSVQVHDADEAAEAGFDGFIAKPFDPDELVEIVSRLATGGRPAR